MHQSPTTVFSWWRKLSGQDIPRGLWQVRLASLRASSFFVGLSIRNYFGIMLQAQENKQLLPKTKAGQLFGSATSHVWRMDRAPHVALNMHSATDCTILIFKNSREDCGVEMDDGATMEQEEVFKSR